MTGRKKKRLSKDGRGMVTRRFDLDSMGQTTWSLMDGKNTVQDMIDYFCSELGFEPVQAEESVTRFLHSLGARELIALLEPSSDN